MITRNIDIDIFIREFYVQGQTFLLKSWVIAESIRLVVVDELRVSVLCLNIFCYVYHIIIYSDIVFLTCRKLNCSNYGRLVTTLGWDLQAILYLWYIGL